MKVQSVLAATEEQSASMQEIASSSQELAEASAGLQLAVVAAVIICMKMHVSFYSSAVGRWSIVIQL
ncbi:MAG: hypothetical protein K0Q73_8681 [Paenibacillus sp.]|nr:hypothetical protein [Paenibacillus sp.]